MLSTTLRSALRPLTVALAAGALLVGLTPGQAHAATPTYKIAVLGDSWASGEGNTPYSSSDGCDQSTTAWAYKTVLAAGGSVSSAQHAGTASVQFLACQGAQNKHVVYESYMGHSPQIKAMSSSTNLVYLSTSGNDLDFVGMLKTCYDYGLPYCKVTIDNTRKNLMPAALDGLRSALKEIHAKVPHAQVIVTGYAPLVGSSALGFVETWSVLHDFALEYNTAERAAVDAFRSTSFNVKFVSLVPTFLGHADGDTKAPWLFPVLGDRKSGHPNADGTTQIAKLVSPLVQLPYGTCPSVVKAGSAKICVGEVQEHLNAWGYNLTVDGVFGAKTTAAVKAFQKSAALDADGLVGPQTKLKLFLL